MLRVLSMQPLRAHAYSRFGAGYILYLLAIAKPARRLAPVFLRTNLSSFEAGAACIAANYHSFEKEEVITTTITLFIDAAADTDRTSKAAFSQSCSHAVKL